MPPLILICGDDDFSVKERARRLYQQWCTELGGFDHETIDAQVGNSGEALRTLDRLREALQTLPFFGSAKAIWFQNCSFLGDERAAESRDVTEALASLADDLKRFRWDNVRLLISAGKTDKRKTFYKTCEKIGTVETYAALSIEDRDWLAKAEDQALKALRARNKQISDEALGELVQSVGPNLRQLHNEIEKLSLFVGAKPRVEVEDVLAIVTRNKQARAFALGDAFGDRDLPRTLRCLDEELWEMQFDREKSPIGLLYGLISKVRALIFLQEALREKWIRPDSDYPRFKAQLEHLPADKLPTDRKFNPLALNPYVLFKALPQARRFTPAELVRAMELLLECNRRLVSSGLEGKLVLQQTLIEILRAESTPASSAA